MGDIAAGLGAIAICGALIAAMLAFHFVISSLNKSAADWACACALVIFVYVSYAHSVTAGYLALIGLLLAGALGSAPLLVYAIWKDRSAE